METVGAELVPPLTSHPRRTALASLHKQQCAHGVEKILSAVFSSGAEIYLKEFLVLIEWSPLLGVVWKDITVI